MNIKDFILKTCSHVTFDFNGKNCGIDPYCSKEYVLWYGEKEYTAKSIEEAVNAQIFEGKSLVDISDNIIINEL